MNYTKEIILTKEETEYVKKCLEAPEKYLNDDFSVTAKFTDELEMDIKICPCLKHNTDFWTEAVLFYNSVDINCSGPEDSFFGEWTLEDDENTYTVIVKPAENPEEKKLSFYKKYFGDIVFPEEVTPEFINFVMENKDKYIISYTGLYWSAISKNATHFEENCMFKEIPEGIHVGTFPELLKNPEDYVYAHIGSTKWVPVKYSDSVAWVYHGSHSHLWFKQK